MVNCEPQSVKKVLEILTREPFMYREGQISDVIRLKGVNLLYSQFCKHKVLFIVYICKQNNFSINFPLSTYNNLKKSWTGAIDLLYWGLNLKNKINK